MIAGLGNIYSDEILHAAGLRYDRLSNTLTVQEVRRLFRAIIEIVHEAVAARGSSLADEQYVDLLRQPGTYQEQHQVYGREGRACLRCRATIERTKWGGRSTFYCPELPGLSDPAPHGAAATAHRVDASRWRRRASARTRGLRPRAGGRH